MVQSIIINGELPD